MIIRHSFFEVANGRNSLKIHKNKYFALSCFWLKELPLSPRQEMRLAVAGFVL